jgi:hypothetical protein
VLWRRLYCFRWAMLAVVLPVLGKQQP